MAFLFNSGSRMIASVAAQEYAQKLQAMNTFALKVIDKCDSIANRIDDKSDKVFVQQLSGYLKTRKSEIRIIGEFQLEDRATFIHELTSLIEKNDIIQQLDKLKEKNICHFKGFFTQRLYDKLVARRTELQGDRISPSPR